MSLGKKSVFAVATLAAFLLFVEGISQVVWVWLESRAFARTRRGGEAVLRNDAINFMKVAHGDFGFVLKPGSSRGGLFVNDQGFAQRERVSKPRQPGTLRVVAMGESTTQGHDVDMGNYPVYLRKLLRAHGRGFSDAEVINAGVAAWVSDQVALRAERELAPYNPDVVILYVGWNDFQSYDPFGPPPTESFFQGTYGARLTIDRMGLRSVALLSAAVTAAHGRWIMPRVSTAALSQPASVRETYRFYLANLDRIIAAYRSTDPRVRIAICTLVGRWPHGTMEEYIQKMDGRTWWMKQHDLTPVQAAVSLARFNDLIREYARGHGVILIDLADSFASLDRGRLQWDFAHMNADGYELMAEVLYRGLVDAGAVQGERSGRLEALKAKYIRADADARRP
jgi:lysophospholipase L1-like esterase